MMDSHTLSLASLYISQQKLRVQRPSKNGSLSVGYVSQRSTSIGFTILIASDA